ncbi:MAG: EmrB/QacA subfamily drug resistance transporter [Ilumatobacter sp.]
MAGLALNADQAPQTDSLSAVESKRAWRAFAVASTSIFLFVLDAGLLSVSLPEIAQTFPDSSRATISWVSTGYLVTVAGLLLVAGRLGDAFGRKRIFLIGMLILGIGSIASGLAPSIELLIGSRMVQGVGGALVSATGLTLALPDIPPHRRALAVGIWGSIGSVAAMLGPTLGAEILDATGWRLALASIGPIALVSYVAGRRLLHESTDTNAPRRLDPPSVLLATLGIGAVSLGLSQSRIWGWGDAKTWAAFAFGLIALTLFLDRSRRHDNPLLGLHLLRIPRYTGPTISAALQQLGFFSWFFSTSFVLSEIWGWSVRETGQAISVTFFFSAITGWAGGKAGARFGMFWPTVVGAVVAAAGPLYWAYSFDTEPSFWTVYLPGAVLFGLGGGICGILTTGMALRSVSDDDQGMAYAAHQTARRMASSFGLALMATLLGEASGTELLGGARNVWIMVAAAHLIMIVPLAFTSRND